MTEFNSGRGGRDDDIVDLEAQPVNATGNSAEGSSRELINYIFRSDASGTWLESHFSWQIRTFWYALLWLVVLYLVSLPLVFFGIGIFVFIAGMLVLGIWVAWRILSGWRRLASHREMPLS